MSENKILALGKILAVLLVMTGFIYMISNTKPEKPEQQKPEQKKVKVNPIFGNINKLNNEEIQLLYCQRICGYEK